MAEDGKAAVGSNDTYAGFTRFEIELEFVQCLGNPRYLNYLAAQKYFDDPAFIAYLDYLQYFSRPRYIQYLFHPGPTLRALQLLQQEKFRKDILNPEVVARLIDDGMKASAGEQDPSM